MAIDEHASHWIADAVLSSDPAEQSAEFIGRRDQARPRAAPHLPSDRRPRAEDDVRGEPERARQHRANHPWATPRPAMSELEAGHVCPDRVRRATTPAATTPRRCSTFEPAGPRAMRRRGASGPTRIAAAGRCRTSGPTINSVGPTCAWDAADAIMPPSAIRRPVPGRRIARIAAFRPHARSLPRRGHSVRRSLGSSGRSLPPGPAPRYAPRGCRDAPQGPRGRAAPPSRSGVSGAAGQVRARREREAEHHATTTTASRSPFRPSPRRTRRVGSAPAHAQGCPARRPDRRRDLGGPLHGADVAPLGTLDVAPPHP